MGKHIVNGAVGGWVTDCDHSCTSEISLLSGLTNHSGMDKGI